MTLVYSFVSILISFQNSNVRLEHFSMTVFRIIFILQLELLCCPNMCWWNECSHPLPPWYQHSYFVNNGIQLFMLQNKSLLLKLVLNLQFNSETDEVDIWWKLKKTFLKFSLKTYEPGHEKMCLMSYANNKGADQPVHPRSLISAFVVRCLDNIISLDSIAEISRL